MKEVRLFPIKTRLLREGDDLLSVIKESMAKMGLEFEDGDILVVSSKAVSTVQGRVVSLSDIRPSDRAKEVARRYFLDPRVAQLIVEEVDVVLGGVPRVLLACKEGDCLPNGGIDRSNVPEGHVALYPKDPMSYAEWLRRRILYECGAKVGVVIADSRVQPSRVGTVGIAIGVAGMEPVEDLRGEKDLFGKVLCVTRRAIADQIASAAELLMGESDERIPAVLVRGLSVQLTDRKIRKEEFVIEFDECLFLRQISPLF